MDPLLMQESSKKWIVFACRAAQALAATSAVFSLAVCVLTLANYVQMRRTDPLNDPALVRMREAFAQNQADEDLKARIRDLDFQVRRVYFSSQRQIRVGGFLMVGGVVMLLVSLQAVTWLRQKFPVLAETPPEDEVWISASRARRIVYGGGVGLLAFVLVLLLLSDRELSREFADAIPQKAASKKGTAAKGVRPAKEKTAGTKGTRPEPAAGKTAGVAAPAAGGREDLWKNWPHFRGPEGSGFTRRKNVPAEWNEKEKKNIAWKVPVPMPGLSSPILWGDRVFLTGGSREKRQAYAFDAKDGKLLWTGTYPSDPKACTEYKVYDSLAALMYAAPTPATDGARVYANFANGELVAFDAQTGKSLWVQVMGDTTDNQYGYSSSVLACDGSVLAICDGAAMTIARYDGATGRELWKTKRDDNTWASPILVWPADGKPMVVTAGSPDVAAWDVETGKKLWSNKVLNGDVAPTPIACAGRVFAVFKGCGIFGFDPAGKELWKLTELEEGGFSETTSPTCDENYVYQFEKDFLLCVDAKTGKVAYTKTVDESSSYASPMVVNDRLYLFCGNVAVVAKTGRQFEVVGKCRLEESSDTSPAVADGRLYVRTEKSLYSITSP